jgi:hypothetical protein
MTIRGVADGAGLLGDVGVKEGLGHDGPREGHHLLMGVQDRAVVPVGGAAGGIGGHGLAVGRDALAVEGGLHEPSLAQPDIALGGEQPIPQECSHQADAATLDEVAVSFHEHFLDGVRVVDQETGERAQAHWHDVAILPRAPGIEAELIAIEVAEAPEDGLALRPSMNGGACGRARRHDRAPMPTGLIRED